MVNTPHSARIATAAPVSAPGEGHTVAAALAHEYRNLLLVLQSCTHELHGYAAGRDTHSRTLSELLATTHQLVGLLEQALAFMPGFVAHPRTFVPAQLLSGIADRLRRLVPDDVDLRLSLHGAERVSCDPLQFQAIVLSLLMHAGDAAGSGGHVILATSDEDPDGSPRHSEGRSQSSVLVTAVLGHTGVPSLPGRRARSRNTALLRQIGGHVRDTGGSMEFRQGDAGAVSFRLAFATVIDAPAEQRVRRRSSSETAIGARVILVADDDDGVRWSVRESLESFGCTVLEARTGAEALRLLDALSDPPDLVLADVVMPELGGSELLHTLRAERRDVKVLLMSGYQEDELGHRSLVNEFPLIVKPFTPRQLAARVMDAIRDADSGHRLRGETAGE